ncbi:MAG: cytochrome P450 [Devosia sp.]
MSDPTLIHGAVTEGVRYEPSIGTIARLAVEPIDIADVWLPAGAVLHLPTLSAIRDPAIYADPDRFDLRRTDHPRLHMAFGLGPHRCIGEMLARIQMKESLAALLDVAPDIALEGAPQMVGFGGIRQITPMPVRIP